MCPNCRAFVTTDDRVCPYCDVKLGERSVDRRMPDDIAGGLIPGSNYTTVLLLLINAGMYVLTAVLSMKAERGGFMDIDGRVLYALGAKLPQAIYAGEWWRLITAGFLHGGILHILMNSWVIYDLGATVEEHYGTSRYLVIYFVSTITGFMASTWWSMSLSVGASAGLFGLIGAMIALGMRSKTSMGAAIRGHYTQWAVWGVAMGFMGFSIDNAAHLGGIAGGFLLAYVAGTPKLTETAFEKLWRLAAIFCVVITVAAFGLMLLNFMRMTSA